jgi:hypothetical protein
MLQSSARVTIKLGDLESHSPCELLVLPCSTAGTYKRWVRKIADRHKLKAPSLTMELGTLGTVQRNSHAHFVFAASVHAEESNAAAITSIGKELGKLSTEYRLIGAPLLGAGVNPRGEARLDPDAAYEALATGFRETGATGSELIILVPEKDRYEALLARAQPKAETARAPMGVGVKLRRESTPDELCLSIDDYADSVAEVLADAEGEVTFALFGAWGRGKTTLVRELSRRLLERTGKPRYRTVWFNAWKYRSPPEVWAHLYERLATGFRSDGWKATLARTLRANLARRGLHETSLAMLFLAVSLIPLIPKLDWLWYGVSLLVGAIGLMTAIWASLAVNKTSTVMKRVWERYSHLPTHQDKLGLQATIGNDLRYLLTGWIPSPFVRNPGPALGDSIFLGEETSEDHRPHRAALACFFVAVLAVASCMLYGLSHFADQVTGWGRLLFAAPVLWLLLWVWISKLVGTVGRTAERVLLIVDDLDRCLPQQMLEIIESVKLLVEEPGVRERLQVMVLVDESVLARAIIQRFDHLVNVDHRSELAAGERRRIVREHLDKLFLGYLRLGRLTDSDVDDLVRGFAPADSSRESSLRTDFQPTITPQPSAINSNAVRVSTADEPALPAGGTPSFDAAPRTFTTEELDAIQRRCRDLLKGHDGDRIGPRAIRSFVFRYQLARRLVHVLKRDVAPDQIAAYVMNALSGADAPRDNTNEISRILDQVTVSDVQAL